jgi:short-subunit dehydrogenase
LFAKDNKDVDAQLINVASAAGYALFVGAALCSATKFFVTALTEGIEHDLQATGGTMRAKLLVPGPIDTEFTAVSLSESKLPRRGTSKVTFHTPDEIADFAYQLYESDHVVGIVDTTDMSFHLGDHVHPTARLARPQPKNC